MIGTTGRMDSVEVIINARLLDHAGLHTLRLADAKIVAVEPQPVEAKPAAGHLDARGGLVLPALVDPHVHLDLAHSVDIVPPNASGTLLEAIGLWSAAKRELSADNVRDRAVRAINEEVTYGTGFIRSHVDVASAAGMRLAEGVMQARAQTRDLCAIQLVAFPQDGLVRDPGAVDLVRQACREGVDLVGGIPHIERTPRESQRHLEIVFDLAAELDADIDVHIDETDDPSSFCTEHLASLTIERGWQGRVTASHVCALAAYDDVHAAKVIDLLHEAQINVVTNPGVNLHLQGRFDGYPKRRGLTRVRQLLDRGIACAAGQDCIRDPFYPLGTGQMLDQAFLLAHADHLTTTPKSLRTALDMVCSMAAKVVGAPHHGLTPGCQADLAAFPVESASELVRRRPLPIGVLHGGRLIGLSG